MKTDRENEWGPVFRSINCANVDCLNKSHPDQMHKTTDGLFSPRICAECNKRQHINLKKLEGVN